MSLAIQELFSSCAVQCSSRMQYFFNKRSPYSLLLSKVGNTGFCVFLHAISYSLKNCFFSRHFHACASFPSTAPLACARRERPERFLWISLKKKNREKHYSLFKTKIFHAPRALIKYVLSRCFSQK